MPNSDQPDSDTTGTDQPDTETDPKTDSGKTSRRGSGGPQPMTVFTGSHGLQADKPRAGEDPDPDDTSTADPDSDVRR